MENVLRGSDFFFPSPNSTGDDLTYRNTSGIFFFFLIIIHILLEENNLSKRTGLPAYIGQSKNDVLWCMLQSANKKVKISLPGTKI